MARIVCPFTKMSRWVQIVLKCHGHETFGRSRTAHSCAVGTPVSGTKGAMEDPVLTIELWTEVQLAWCLQVSNISSLQYLWPAWRVDSMRKSSRILGRRDQGKACPLMIRSEYLQVIVVLEEKICSCLQFQDSIHAVQHNSSQPRHGCVRGSRLLDRVFAGHSQICWSREMVAVAAASVQYRLLSLVNRKNRMKLHRSNYTACYPCLNKPHCDGPLSSAKFCQ